MESLRQCSREEALICRKRFRNLHRGPYGSIDEDQTTQDQGKNDRTVKLNNYQWLQKAGS